MDLEEYITEEGPFDGVMAFSQGAGLAASLLLHRMQQDPEKALLYPVFRCAIFFSGGVPEDPKGLMGGGPRRLMRLEDDGEVINIPSVHIWGRNDELHPDFGPVLSRLCRTSQREEHVHDEGHVIPGPKDHVAVQKVTKLIKRTIERAEAVH